MPESMGDRSSPPSSSTRALQLKYCSGDGNGDVWPGISAVPSPRRSFSDGCDDDGDGCEGLPPTRSIVMGVPALVSFPNETCISACRRFGASRFKSPDSLRGLPG